MVPKFNCLQNSRLQNSQHVVFFLRIIVLKNSLPHTINVHFTHVSHYIIKSKPHHTFLSKSPWISMHSKFIQQQYIVYWNTERADILKIFSIPCMPCTRTRLSLCSTHCSQMGSGRDRDFASLPYVSLWSGSGAGLCSLHGPSLHWVVQEGTVSLSLWWVVQILSGSDGSLMACIMHPTEFSPQAVCTTLLKAVPEWHHHPLNKKHVLQQYTVMSLYLTYCITWILILESGGFCTSNAQSGPCSVFL